jgi:TonB family protein
MKKKLLLLSLITGPLLAYSADMEIVTESPVQEEIKVAEPRHVTDEDEDIDYVYKIVEKKAEFPGGQRKLMEYLKKNVKYPKQALDKSIEGRVLVKFTIKKDGTIDDIRVIKGVDSILDEEAIRVVKNMPKWIPGQSRGKDVNSQFTLPIRFSIGSKEGSDKK